jgi:substrate import-associated zinc metallohydrolase lipoprotein
LKIVLLILYNYLRTKEMKKTFLNISILALSMGLFFGCSSKVEDVSAKVDGLGGEVLAKQALDTWIEQTLTKPYNIEVKYRWDPYEVPLGRTLVPPLVEKVRPIMEGVKAIWIDPYEKVAGSDFIKKFCPKQYVLVGSANYNRDGTVTLGTAEGGRKVVLYTVNFFDKKYVGSNNDFGSLKQQLHTIHHEFGHILQQNVAPSIAFRQITPSTYTSNWYNVSESQALSLGYVSSYAMSKPDEDFVEVLAMMLVEGKPGYDALVNAAPNTAAKTALRQKQQLVVDYMQNTYKINFTTLQTLTQNAIKEFSK